MFYRRLGLAAVMLALAPLSWSAESLTAIHAGELLAVPGTPPLRNQTIVVKDGRILDVQSGFEDAASFDVDVNIIDLLDQLVARRHELARLMNFDTYADYTLSVKMAESPDNVWDFLNGLVEATSGKAVKDLDRLKAFRSEANGTSMAEPLQPAALGYTGQDRTPSWLLMRCFVPWTDRG